jgi:hypothetical protein
LAHSQGLGRDGLPDLRNGDAELWSSAPFAEFAGAVKASRRAVYAHQVPCNRCVFLGNGCLPCPLSADPAVHTTNHQCLIAERLIETVRARPDSAEPICADEETALARNVVRDNPPRPRTLTDA